MAIAAALSADQAAHARTQVASIPMRVWITALILALECLLLSRFPRPGHSVQQIMAAPIVFYAALLFFARARLQAARLDNTPIHLRFVAIHILALAFLAIQGTRLRHLAAQHALPSHGWEPAWYVGILLLVFSLAATLFPLRRLWIALRTLGSPLIFAALTTVVAMSSRTLSRWIWNAPDSRLGHLLQVGTFAGVRGLLHFFYNDVVARPDINLLGTSRYRVQVIGACSGIEGLALVLVFCLGWLIFARRELRLSRAMFLVPIALGITWLLNLARIAALIALGDAGHVGIAKNGFHSEAGWILFNAVALGFLLTAEHLRWIRRDTPASTADPLDRNVAAVYLLPFLTVLATSLLTRAASNGFEALYPVRLLVAVAVLFWYRDDYRRLDWRFGWLGPAAGVALFPLWLLLSHLTASTAPTGLLAAQLAQLHPVQRVTWITLRILSAVIAIPLIEELAFRGYIARRIQSADIEALPFAQLSFVAILLSSVAFGALHGRMWFAGILSGLVFALVAKYRNRLGEAVAAHATTNLLIALWVLSRGDYSLW